MTDQPKPAITDFEIASVRNALNLLRSQISAGRVDDAFLGKIVDKVDDVIVRLGEERVTRGQVLGSSLDLQIVLDQVMDAIIQLSGAERGFLMLRDDDGGLTVKAARNFDQQTLSSEEFKYSRTITNQVLDSGKPILTSNAAEDPRFANQASIVNQALHSIMATPLRARGSVIGVVYVDSRVITSLFTGDDLTALDAFSAQAAIALDNAMLFSATDQELTRRIEELRQLRRVDLLLNETLDPDQAIDYTLEWACRVAGAASGHLALLEAKEGSIQAVHHYGTTELGMTPDHLEVMHPQAAQVARTGQAITTASNGHSILIIPIRREAKVIGLVILERPDGQPFSDEQQDVAERVVARAAVTIENARLYSAVQAADRAKSEFVGIVAHDLKAPMTGIKGYADLLLMQGGLDERQKDFLQRIRNTVQRMEILVSDLADISRIESGHFFMEATLVPVAEVIQAVKDGTLPQIQERGHTLLEEVESNLPTLHVDYYRLLQVLTNLVSNAYKYTPDGGTITLSARRKDDGVEFSVSDTGIGLSPEDIARLGTRFWRAEDDFTRSQPGTGLGFAITRSLVEQMGSQISITSAPGTGSTFTFSIEIAEDQHADK
jgi:signal transduction histidine kinase